MTGNGSTIRLIAASLLGIVVLAVVHFIAWRFVVYPNSVEYGRDSVRISQAEYVYSNSESIPMSGWKKARLPFHDFFAVETSENRDRKAVWIKVEFDLSHSSPALISALTDYSPERFAVYLNGAPIFRNASSPSERIFASFAPAKVDLPPAYTKHGKNLLFFRMESDTVWCLGIGHLWIGSRSALEDRFRTLNFWQYEGPQLVNAVIAVLSLCVFIVWYRRKQEKEFFWLALVGGVWFLRNLHYSAVAPIWGATVMWEIATNCLLLTMFTFYGFVATFLRVKHRPMWLWFSGLATVAMVVIRYILVFNGLSDGPAFLLMLPLTFVLYGIFFDTALKTVNSANLVMLAAVTIAISYSTHDFGFLAGVWNGAGFQIQPYGSLIVFSAFLYSAGRRVLFSFDAVENMNLELGRRINDANRKLLESENARHALEVQTAVESERERMMREMHDRIGSNLISALSAAERRGDPKETISTLKDSLADLRLAVDSLEPFDGDITLLLASFRHRTERQLKSAGLSYRWDVQPVPRLHWLDAVNALHLLRTIQQGVANIIEHAQAAVIKVTCASKMFAGNNGVEIALIDDGKGFDITSTKPSRGLRNMAERIAAVGGQFGCHSSAGAGTAYRIWLPTERDAANEIFLTTDDRY